jgi:6-phosphogluconolactonase
LCPTSPLSFAAVFTPFGQLLVADDGANGTSATSSYRVNSNGTLTSTQPSLPDAQTAACWNSFDRNGDFFVSNAGRGTMGSYEVLPDGRLAFLGNASAGAGAHPLDSAVSPDGKDLYVLDGNLDRISVFAIGRDAQLSPIGTQAVPAGSAGIAAS